MSNIYDNLRVSMLKKPKKKNKKKKTNKQNK